MRKNSPRKWLHACLDLLPLVVIPVFMIYSHRHTIDNYTVVRTEPLEVNAFQYVNNGLPINTEGFYSDDNTFNYSNGFLNVVADADSSNINCYFDDISVNQYTYLYVSFDYIFTSDTASGNFYLSAYFEGNGEYVIFENELKQRDLLYSSYFKVSLNAGGGDDILEYLAFIGSFDNDDFVFSIKNIMIFDLTTIFGSGNEPSADVFNSYLTQDYYVYGNNTLNVGTHDVTYNDTDIGSQFTYTLYNTTEKYFNFNQVFNLNSFWSWINLNLFGGSAPLMAKTIWNIIVYEFVIDLLFVFYAFFMFLIDFTDSLLEKPFNKGR